MLLDIGPLQIGQACSVAANSSLTHALHSGFLHLNIFVGFNFGFSSSLIATLLISPLHSITYVIDYLWG
jgi:hypothetical protein